MRHGALLAYLLLVQWQRAQCIAVAQKAPATAGCGNLVIPAQTGGTVNAISEEERCSLYCLLENVPVGVDALKLSRDAHYKKCAVVSNSGAMLKRRFGSEIDAADAVMRFGTPDLDRRYQAHVGKKETFRFLNAQVQGQVPSLSLGSFGSGIFLVTDGSEKDGAAQPGIVPLGETHRGLMQVIRDTFPRFEYKPTHEVTAGMTGITLLLHVCDEVVLYEMIASPAALGQPWHYWELGGDATRRPFHNTLFFEQAVWRLLAGAQGRPDTGRVSLQGFRTRPEQCGPRPTPLPTWSPKAPLAAPECADVTIRLAGRRDGGSDITDEQRCSLYCRLENLVPRGRAVRELMDRVHYRTCAVVSNGDALLKWTYGSQIDSTGAVMRFDMAKTGSRTQRHTGSKETFRLLNARLQSQAVSGLRLGALGEGVFLLTDGWPNDHMPVGEPGMVESELFAAQPGIVPAGEVKHGLMEVLARTFPEFTHTSGDEVSSGMMGITLMLHFCDQVALYEMVPSKATKGDATKNSLHYEYAVWRALAGPVDTSESGVIWLEGFRKHAAQCRAAHSA